MAKPKSTYFCQNCGAQAPKWIGHCPACGEWNTYVEEVIQKETGKNKLPFQSQRQSSKPVKIEEIQSGKEIRIDTRNQELNRVLGGGLVSGSVVLIGGEPGIGKSTLVLQIALHLGNCKVLYVTGEESEQQIKMRSERIGASNDNCYVLAETSTQNIFQHIEKENPQLVVIDSVQTLHTEYIESSAGSISQIRECAAEFQKFAKVSGSTGYSNRSYHQRWITGRSKNPGTYG